MEVIEGRKNLFFCDLIYSLSFFLQKFPTIMRIGGPSESRSADAGHLIDFVHHIRAQIADLHLLEVTHEVFERHPELK